MAGHHTSHAAGLPHSDTLGSPSVHQLPEAYRRSPRPSSAPDTKASTMRSYTLTTLIKRAANQITHNNKQSRRSFIRCSRPLFTNTTTPRRTTQQCLFPHNPTTCPPMRYIPHPKSTQHTHTTHKQCIVRVFVTFHPKISTTHKQHVWFTHPTRVVAP